MVIEGLHSSPGGAVTDRFHVQPQIAKVKTNGSWWLQCETREAFVKAAEQEQIRMKRSRVSTPGENKIVWTSRGRV